MAFIKVLSTLAYACDGNCVMAYGKRLRLKTEDGRFLSDAQMAEQCGPAPWNISGGGCRKPRADETKLNEWCRTCCERAITVFRPGDGEGRFAMTPSFACAAQQGNAFQEKLDRANYQAEKLIEEIETHRALGESIAKQWKCLQDDLEKLRIKNQDSESSREKLIKEIHDRDRQIDELQDAAMADNQADDNLRSAVLDLVEKVIEPEAILPDSLSYYRRVLRCLGKA